MESAHQNPASLFVSGRNCSVVAHGDRVAFLVDGAAYFDTFARAAQRAERSILILAWDFDSRAQLSAGGGVADRSASGQPVLGDFLNELVRRRRRLHVHVLNWDYPVIFGMDRELPPVYGLSWHPHRRTHLRYDGTHPLAGCQHQKVVVIDDRIAFAGGLDLTCRRWDTPDHKAADPRRTAAGKPYPPFHDMMMVVDGEAARELGNLARARWLAATGERLRPPRLRSSSDPWPDSLRADLTDVPASISCTSPADENHPEVRHVERLYLDMIGRAQRYIYAENQYFTSHVIADALAARLAEPEGPEVVLVTRCLSHGWLEEMTMHVLRTDVVRRLREADRFNRFHVYYPHVPGLSEGTCIDVHSKMMIVDDEWLRIGSANLSNRSMGLDVECDLTIEAGGIDERSTRIREFRDQLIAEQRGVILTAVAQAVAATSTLHEAIDQLGSETRCLRELEVEDWPEGVVKAIAISDPERPVSLDSLMAQLAPEPEPGKMPGRNWRLQVIIGAALLLGLALAWRYTPLANYITPEIVSRTADTLSGYWWAPLALIAVYTPAALLMFPRPLITLACGIAFGPWLGLVYAMTGVQLSALITYGLGRRMQRNTVRRIAGERLNRLGHCTAATRLRGDRGAKACATRTLRGRERGRWRHAHQNQGFRGRNLRGHVAGDDGGDGIRQSSGACLERPNGQRLAGDWRGAGGADCRSLVGPPLVREAGVWPGRGGTAILCRHQPGV